MRILDRFRRDGEQQDHHAERKELQKATELADRLDRLVSELEYTLGGQNAAR